MSDEITIGPDGIPAATSPELPTVEAGTPGAVSQTPEPDTEGGTPRDHLAGPTRLESLKERADALGITYSNNIGEDTLAERIAKFLEDAENTGAPAEPGDIVVKPLTPSQRNALPSLEEMLAMTTDDLLMQPEARREQIIRARQKSTEMRLVRCQVYNNNPAKNELKGEIFSVGNKYLGTVRKYIPYGEFTENGYHIPAILVNMLRGKRYQRIRSVKQNDGTEKPEMTLAPEFTINELRPLTVEELKQLAQMQAARNSASMGFVGAA